jgi:2-polyprenyl-3-methyl-5-hydroxy-6-metoxy-1,4-benzoquinol methylase
MKKQKYLESRKYIGSHYKQFGDIRNDFRNYNLFKLIASKAKGNSVLDIGCGSGSLLRILDENGFKACGIEPNADLINLAKKANPRSKTKF